MTSATLYREGPDLDELLAELDAEHGGVRVVDVTYDRDGGVMGFFARRRVGVHYVIDGSAAPALSPAAAPVDALLQAAEMVESGRVPDGTSGDTDNVEFARMLLDLAAQKRAAAAQTALAPATPTPTHVDQETDPVDIRPRTSLDHELEETRAALLARVRTRPVGAHRAPTEPPTPLTDSAQATAPARTPYTLRRQLVEIGVPVAWIPADDANAYQVVEQLVRLVPVPREQSPEPGDVVAVVGPGTLARAEARRLCSRLRLDPTAVRTAGCGAEPISQPREAAALARRHRSEGDAPLVVVIATDATVDGTDPGGLADQEWAAAVVAALAPDQVLAVLDASCKPADARAQLALLGPVTGLAVIGAARTTSPAALWQLDVPIMLLDGRPATRGAWAALLIDRLAALDE